jgi:hypothetical protein
MDDGIHGGVSELRLCRKYEMAGFGDPDLQIPTCDES